MELAERCTDMVSAALIQLPVGLPPVSLPLWMVNAIEVSRTVWYLNVYKLELHQPFKPADDDFMQWVMSKD